MTKPVVAVSRRDAKRKMKKSKDSMVFPKIPVGMTSKDPRQRQLSTILAGLNYLKAPVASSLQTQDLGTFHLLVSFIYMFYGIMDHAKNRFQHGFQSIFSLRSLFPQKGWIKDHAFILSSKTS